MIFVSSSCVKHENIKESVKELAENGFKNIELSGGTKYYENLEKDLLELKNKHNLSYRCHNYFPPPKKPFVLNLASLNNETFQKSFDHLQEVIALSERLEADKFGFHAGFFIDIKLDEIGKKLSKDKLFDREKGIDRFCKSYEKIKKKTKNVSLYIENNVFSKTNAKTYKNQNPFMMTNFEDYKALKKKIDFNLLLDLAHLKVSVNTLNLNFEEEFTNMIRETNYFHISDNDGLHDTNNELIETSNILKILKKSNIKDKDFTLEIYDGMKTIKNSYDVLSKVIS